MGGTHMAKASRILLLVATVGLFLLSVIMLLNSDSELMAIPLIGVSVLTGFGYMMFDAESPEKQTSTPGAIEHHRRSHHEVNQNDGLPDITQSDYDLPLL